MVVARFDVGVNESVFLSAGRFPPRSLKREMRKLAQDECGYEEPTVAMAFVYFEKLVLQGKLNKQNRKLCAGACVLLAAKIGGDLKKHEVKLLIDVSNTPLVDGSTEETISE